MVPWLPAWVDAVRANVRALRGAPAPREAVRVWRALVPYRYDADAHRIASFHGCMLRGYGACADSSAFIAAAAIARGLSSSHRLCIQQGPGIYHARIVDDNARPLDPSPLAVVRAASEVPCLALAPLRALVPEAETLRPAAPRARWPRA